MNELLGLLSPGHPQRFLFGLARSRASVSLCPAKSENNTEVKSAAQQLLPSPARAHREEHEQHGSHGSCWVSSGCVGSPSTGEAAPLWGGNDPRMCWDHFAYCVWDQDNPRRTSRSCMMAKINWGEEHRVLQPFLLEKHLSSR